MAISEFVVRIDTDPIRIAVAATLRMVAEWGYVDDHGRQVRDELRSIADQVDALELDDMCCPVCEEVDCDGHCPLAAIRSQADEDAARTPTRPAQTDN